MVKWGFFQPSSEKIHQALRGIILNIINFSEKKSKPETQCLHLCGILHTEEAQVPEQEQKLWVPQFIKIKTLAKDSSQVN